MANEWIQHYFTKKNCLLFLLFRHAVCIFYLVLRALDTVEDDMTIPLDDKVSMLQNFYKNLEDPSWKYMKSKDKDRIVLEDFPTVSLLNLSAFVTFYLPFGFFLVSV